MMQTVDFSKNRLCTNFPPLFEGRSGKKSELQTVVEKCTVCIIYANISLFSPNSNIAPFSNAACMSKKRRQKTARQLIFYIIYIFIYLIRVRGDIILYIFMESYCLAVFCLLNI